MKRAQFVIFLQLGDLHIVLSNCDYCYDSYGFGFYNFILMYCRNIALPKLKKVGLQKPFCVYAFVCCVLESIIKYVHFSHKIQ